MSDYLDRMDAVHESDAIEQHDTSLCCCDCQHFKEWSQQWDWWREDVVEVDPSCRVTNNANLNGWPWVDADKKCKRFEAAVQAEGA